ncbi:MAG TPA: hypothetical protein VJ895_00635 [Candidatus Nanoarchaeia archaeon]|nr:hypothetical protein [Candidatus Nanoarchaeia archaeon]
MKNLMIILTVVFALAANETFSQDIIILQNGDEIFSKVTKVGSDEIEYKKFENLSGPIYSLEKSKIFMVKYENGTKDVFKKEKSHSPVIEKESGKESHSEVKAPKEKQDNFDFVLGLNVGIGTLQGSDVQKVYNKGETHFRVMGGTRIKHATLFLFYEKTTASGHPVDENLNQYSNIESKFYMSLVGIQANFGKVDNSFYLGPRLADVIGKEKFSFAGETAEASISGSMVGAVFGFRTQKRFELYGELTLDYFSFENGGIDEEALLEGGASFFRIGVNAGFRLRL